MQDQIMDQVDDIIFKDDSTGSSIPLGATNKQAFQQLRQPYDNRRHYDLERGLDGEEKKTGDSYISSYQLQNQQLYDDLSSLGTHSVVRDAAIAEYNRSIRLKNEQTEEKPATSAQNHTNGVDPPAHSVDKKRSPGRLLEPPMADVEAPSTPDDDDDDPEKHPGFFLPRYISSRDPRLDTKGNRILLDDPEEERSIMSSIGNHSVVSDYERAVRVDGPVSNAEDDNKRQREKVSTNKKQRQQKVPRTPSKDNLPEANDDDKKDPSAAATAAQARPLVCSQWSAVSRLSLLAGVVLCSIALILLGVYMATQQQNSSNSQRGSSKYNAPKPYEPMDWKTVVDQLSMSPTPAPTSF